MSIDRAPFGRVALRSRRIRPKPPPERAPLLPNLLASFALVIAILAYLRSRPSAQGGSEDAGRDARRKLAGQIAELEERLQAQSRWLCMLAAGEPLKPEMIAEGQFFHDVDPERVKELCHSQGAFLLDVRTAQEVERGLIPGAIWIPMDQVEARQAELPRDRQLVVYCASGGRSASVCQFLATQGFAGLHNLQDGIQSWPGELQRPNA